MTIKKSIFGIALNLSLVNSALALGPTRDTPEAEARKGAQRLSQLLGGMPVMMATPLEDEGDKEDECAHQQLRSLIQTLKSMPTETRGRVVEDLKAAGIRSLEIKRTSPQNQQRIIGERIIVMGERKKRYRVDGINSSFARYEDSYGEVVYYDQLRLEEQSFSQAERLPSKGFEGEGGSLLHNVENSILERAKGLQNDAKLRGGLLAITPRSHKYILHRLEYLARPIAWAKLYHGDHKFKEFLSFLKSGELEQTESVWTTENQPHLDACFGSLSLGDLLSASPSASGSPSGTL